MVPPFYVKAMEALRGAEASRNDALLTPRVSLEAMFKNGVSTSMLSVTEGVAADSMSDGSERARALARQNNEYGATGGGSPWPLRVVCLFTATRSRRVLLRPR